MNLSRFFNDRDLGALRALAERRHAMTKDELLIRLSSISQPAFYTALAIVANGQVGRHDQQMAAVICKEVDREKFFKL